MAFAQGAVLVLPFPYSDRLAEKRRPALVVSSADLEAQHGLIWVTMITSDRGGRRMDDMPIKDPARAGLSVASLIRPSKIATIEPSRVVRQAGSIAPSELKRVLETVRKFL
jgi:mRNA interferase MazF